MMSCGRERTSLLIGPVMGECLAFFVFLCPCDHKIDCAACTLPAVTESGVCNKKSAHTSATDALKLQVWA